MGATENEGRETVLVLTCHRELLPLSVAGLSVSSGRKSRVTNTFQGALVFRRGSRVERIERIEFLGYFGRGVWGRLFSFANGGIRSVKVHLSQDPKMNFTDVKLLITEVLRNNWKQQVLLFDEERPAEAVIRLVEESGNAEDLFTALQVPTPENALDILSPGRER